MKSKNGLLDKVILFFVICYCSLVFMSILATPILTVILFFVKGDINFTIIIFSIFAFYGWIKLLLYWIKVYSKLEKEYKQKYGWKWD